MTIQWITDREAATILGLHLRDFYDAAEAADLACRVPADGVRRYLATEVERLRDTREEARRG